MICEQRYEFDCFLACITAAVDGNYRKLWEAPINYKSPAQQPIGYNFVQRMLDKKGIYGDDVDRAFSHAGLAKNKDYRFVPVPLAAINCAKQLLVGRRAILQVTSLNNEGATHIVYWDGVEVHDPSQKQKYKWLQSMLIQNVWILTP
jgi:hypothetical protein